jgi:hypothetical protein
MTESDHIMQLLQQVANLHGLLVKAKAERDEARREVCAWQGATSEKSFRDIATIRGWDCWKENP